MQTFHFFFLRGKQYALCCFHVIELPLSFLRQHNEGVH